MNFPKLRIGYCDQLKGLAILLVIFGHLNGKGFLDIKDARYLGAVGVDIFLFLSGFGLTKSYMKKGINNSFLIRRIKKVMVPYWIITLIFIFIDEKFKGARYITKDIVLTFIGFNVTTDPTMWFISYILICYTCFFIFFRIRSKNITKFILMCVAMAIITFKIYKLSYGDASFEYYLHCLAFPIGCFISLYSTKLAKFFTKKQLLTLFILLGLICPILYVHYLPTIQFSTKFYIFINISLMTFFISLVMIWSYFNLKSKLLIRIGKLSFYLYLFEAVFLLKYPILDFENKTFSLIIYLIVILILSNILDKTINKIYSKNTIKKHHQKQYNRHIGEDKLNMN